MSWSVFTSSHAMLNTCSAGSSDLAGAGGSEDFQALTAELQDWQSLHVMSQQLLATPQLADQLSILLRTVLQVHGATQGSIALYDHDQDALIPVASAGFAPDALACIAKVAVGAGACGKAFASKCRVIIVDTQTDPVYDQYRDFSSDSGFRAVCSTPFADAKGVALGVISIYLSQSRAPTDRELRLTDVCVGHVALLVSRAEAESALSIERARSLQVLETMSDGFVVMDRQFRIVQINAEAVRIDGRPASELVGLTHWEAWPGSEALPLGAHYKRAMDTRTAVHFEQEYRHEGQDRCFKISAYPYANGLALLYTDVTDRKVHERRIEESNHRFLQLANTIPQLAWVADPTGYIDWYNERWYDYTGTTLEQMQGWGWQTVHHPDTLEE
ncbi:MAG: PAS domain-containing protein, partial [Telluria sp.]